MELLKTGTIVKLLEPINTWFRNNRSNESINAPHNFPVPGELYAVRDPFQLAGDDYKFTGFNERIRLVGVENTKNTDYFYATPGVPIEIGIPQDFFEIISEPEDELDILASLERLNIII